MERARVKNIQSAFLQLYQYWRKTRMSDQQSVGIGVKVRQLITGQHLIVEVRLAFSSLVCLL